MYRMTAGSLRAQPGRMPGSRFHFAEKGPGMMWVGLTTNYPSTSGGSVKGRNAAILDLWYSLLICRSDLNRDEKFKMSLPRQSGISTGNP